MTSAAAGGAPRVAVIGGGLAGLAAAVALGSSGARVELFESRRSLGGRAASFRDPATDELVDHCQHVSMGCCTNLADFCQRTGIASLFRRDRVLHFVGPDARHYQLAASPWLPAPLHLAAGFWGLKYLSARDRLKVGQALWQLMRAPAVDAADAPTVGQWLRARGQSDAAIANFWNVILVSALGESLDRASLAAARKVLVDGFMAARDAYAMEVPIAPLGVLYGERLQTWLAEHGVDLHFNAPVRQLAIDPSPRVTLADGQERAADFVVLALPWSKVAGVLKPELASQLPWLSTMSQVEGSPITGVHLWFDRPIMDVPHAVLVGRLSQWVFHRAEGDRPAANQGHYYQVVISASRELAGRDRQQIVAEVCDDLAAIWPACREAQLLNARVVTEHEAVFSTRPGLESIRPAQQTPLAGLIVAGDWTATGWPATMESAVRSGYLAAEAVWQTHGRPQKFLVSDLPRGWLARLLIK